MVSFPSALVRFYRRHQPELIIWSQYVMPATKTGAPIELTKSMSQKRICVRLRLTLFTCTHKS